MGGMGARPLTAKAGATAPPSPSTIQKPVIKAPIVPSSETTEPELDRIQPAIAPPGPVPASAPISAEPASPPRSSVASMFSWVARPEAPKAEPAAEARVDPLSLGLPRDALSSLDLPREPVPPFAPAPPVAPVPPSPPVPPKRPEAPESRSVTADEPIALSTEETLVLIHYDQGLGLDALAERTGLTEFRLTRLVSALKKRGVLDEPAPPVPPTPPEPPAQRARSADAPSAYQEADRRRLEEREDLAVSKPTPAFPPLAPQPKPTATAARMRDDREEPEDIETHPTILELELGPMSAPPSSAGPARKRTEEYAFPPSEPAPDTETTVVDEGAADLPDVVDDFPVPVEAEGDDLPMVSGADLPAVPEGDDLPSALAALAKKKGFPAIAPKLETSTTPSAPAAEEEGADDGEEAPESQAASEEEKDHDTASVLAHYEMVLSRMSTDERSQLATTTSSSLDLLALCYDKEPEVIRALWQNVNVSHDTARFAAFHHRTPMGLDLIAQRSEFMKDQPTQRRLLRNPSVSEALLRRILLPKRLLEIYKVTLDREASERTRASARSFLRNKFATTEPEDRLEIIWKTEGRCLNALSGLSIDSKTAALICSRQIVSMMLVQSFTRFAATPPSVISHFLKQPLVKRQLHLRNALLKHPNCPSDAKRAF